MFREIGAGPMTFGRAIRAFRLADEATLEGYATSLGVSRQNLCDVEKERRPVSLERAASWAQRLEMPEQLFVEYALRSMLVQAGMTYDVSLVQKKRAPRKRSAG